MTVGKHVTLVLILLIVLPTVSFAQISQQKLKDGGFVWVPADEWYKLRNEMGAHFERARTELKAGRPKDSANEIRKGVVFVRAEALRAQEEYAKNLEICAKKLDRIAKLVEDRKIKVPKELDKAFSETHYWMAKHHSSRVEKALKDQDPKTLMRALRRVSDEVEYSHISAHVELGSASMETLEAAKLLSSASAENTPGLFTKAKDLMRSLGKEIENLGTKMKWGD